MTFPTGITHHWTSPAPVLSILILTLPEREGMLADLLGELDRQRCDGVEILVNSSLRQSEGGPTVGAKRQACIDESDGRYVAFMDDDDRPGKRYLEAVMDAAKQTPAPDVISFWQEAVTDNTNPFIVRCKLGNPREQQRKIQGRQQDILRPPWHWCFWRSEIARRNPFETTGPLSMYGEDWDWVRRMIRGCKIDANIPEVLHHYRFDRAVTATDPAALSQRGA